MMQRLFFVIGVLLTVPPAFGQEVAFDVPPVVLTGIPFDVSVTSNDVLFDASHAASYTVRMDGAVFPMHFKKDKDGARRLVAEGLRAAQGGPVTVELAQGGVTMARAMSRSIPGWLSLLPPLLAILAALLFKRVVPALFLGIWAGAWIAVGSTGVGSGLLDALQVYVRDALLDGDRVSVILFTVMIGGMVGIIARSGGMQGVVNRIVGWASTARRGQITTGVLGLMIFFDDYANTLVVGNTMRPVTDRLRISREKLAYIVDSTAAPVSCLAFVTTWIGYEVGIIGDAVDKIAGFSESAYSIFLHSIPYSFYPILAIFFVFSIAYSRRDFGAMYEAERRARWTGQVLGPGAGVDEAAESKEVQPKAGKPQRAVNAVVPIVVLVGGVMAGLYATGLSEAQEAVARGEETAVTLRLIIGKSDSYAALVWASLVGMLIAGGLAMGQRILTLGETVEAWYAGFKSMLFGLIILVLAWSLADITEVLHTAAYLVSVLGDTLPAGIVPALIFILSAATAFATGSSWGTMGILMPLVVPLVWAVLQFNDMADPPHFYILYSTVACVLAGSVWGDHVSPISDTTILSSMASGCDHIEHVRTQMPYALAVGFVAVFVGTLPTGFGFPWWASLLIAVAVLSVGLRYGGKTVEDVAEHAA